MGKPKVSANERALRRLIEDYYEMRVPRDKEWLPLWSYLASHSTLVINAKTVPDAEWSDSYVRPGNRSTLRDWLRRLARGKS